MVTFGRTPVSNLATPRDDGGDFAPTMYSTGTFSVRNACSGVARDDLPPDQTT